MVGSQLFVDVRVSLPESFYEVKGAVIFWQLLLDDVSFDGDAKVIRVCGGIGSYVIILVFGIYCAVSQIAPQHREHP